MASAIDYVKLKSGSWVEGTDSPDDMLAQAALRMAEMMAQRPIGRRRGVRRRPDVPAPDVRPPSSVRDRMKGQLVGARCSLKARLRSMGQSFKPMGKDWATDHGAPVASACAPRRTGKLARSFKVRSRPPQRRAIVDAIWYAKFTNTGTRPHTIKAKRRRASSSSAGGQTIFTKKVKHPGTRGTGFVDKAAHQWAA